ncbi:MAG: CHAT domain-containing protein [Terriglobales bacterium]
MEGDFLCPNCGQPDSRFNPQGFAFGKATSWRETLVILHWTLQGVCCSNCKHPFERNPNIGYLSPDSREIFIVQSPNPDFVTGFQALIQWLQQFHCEVHGLETLADLRSSIQSLSKVAAKQWNGFLQNQEQRNQEQHIAENWRLLTPQTISLTYLSTLGLFKGMKASSSPETFQQFLTEIQFKSWLALAKEWITAPPSDSTFEEDLEKYVRSESVLDGITDLFSKIISVLDAQALGERERYCMEALFATIADSIGVQNPRSSAWAKAYVNFEMSSLDIDNLTSDLARLSVASERVRKTLNYRDLWDASVPFATIYGDRDGVAEIHQRLTRLLTKAGYPELLNDLLMHGTLVTGPSDLIVEAISKAMLEMRERFGKVTPASVDPFVQVLLKSRDIDMLKRLADQICTINGSSPNAHAEALAWLGSHLKTLRLPGEFLAMAGDEAAPWEEEADPVERASLWVERSNHLRLSGRSRDALLWIEKCLPLLKDASPQDQRVVSRNYAILLRESGDLAESARILAELKDATSGTERIELLESLALTLLGAGDKDGALRAVDEIRPYFNALSKSHSIRVHALGALLLQMVDRESDALTQLLALNVDDCEGTALLAFASAWATAINSNMQLFKRPDVIEITAKLLDQLAFKLKEAQDTGDVMLAEGLAILTGELLEDISLKDALSFYELSVQLAFDNGMTPPLRPLMKLAEAAFSDTDMEGGRALLAAVPLAFRETYKRLDFTLGLPPKEDQFGAVINDLNAAVINHSDEPTDWRTSLDASRDIFSRAATLQKNNDQFVSDEAIVEAAKVLGNFAVVEWIRGTNQALVTFANKTHVKAELLTAPVSHFGKISERIRWRLASWTEGRQGDPLDVDDWKTIRDWLMGRLLDLIPEPAHVVIIDSESTAGMPWHQGLGQSWSVSYAPSWFYLLGLPHVNVDRQHRDLGVVSVPRFADNSELLRAMEESDERAKNIARDHSMNLQIALGKDCDKGALAAVLGASDIARIVCHGFVQPYSLEVAWMVASSGQLPPSGAIQVKNTLHKRHIVGWRDLLRVDRTPRTVFSGACSSGFQHVVNVGEHLGIFFGLRSRGTRALVAPHWDVVGQRVLPVLDRAMELYVTKNSLSLAAAVRHACLETAQNCKPWLAWAIAVEGDWR